MMENRDKLCFPHLLNSSCLKPRLHQSKSLFLNFLLFISLITVALNLLVIITVSHFRQRSASQQIMHLSFTNVVVYKTLQNIILLNSLLTLFIYLLSHCRQLHTPTNIILLSLAISDFLVGGLLMPLEIFRNSSCWLLGDTLCSLCLYMFCHIGSTSVGNVVFVSIDRYTAICDPLHYPTRITVAKVKCGVCLCWLCAASCSFLFVKDELIQPGRSRSCFGECKIVLNYTVSTCDLVVNFIFPVTAIIVLYMRVFVVAVSQARAMRSHITAAALQKSGNVKTKKSELKAARTLGVLVFVFLLCFCPYYCVSFAVSDLLNASSLVYVYFPLCLNSCLNPVIYTLFYPWFRKAIKLIVTLQILRPGTCEANIL